LRGSHTFSGNPSGARPIGPSGTRGKCREIHAELDSNGINGMDANLIVVPDPFGGSRLSRTSLNADPTTSADVEPYMRLACCNLEMHFMESSEPRTSVIVISDNTLTQLGIEALFTQSRFEIEHQLKTINQALERTDLSGGLIIVSSSLDDEIIEPLKLLRHAYPQSRIVLFADRVQLPPDKILTIFGVNLNGCLLCDASIESIHRSLDLIMMGEKVFPVSLLVSALRSETASESIHRAGRLFSDRERQVLQLLSDGASNKFIARSLRLSEATVKVHVKTLIRKIGCTNRTQAAVWITGHRTMWAAESPRLNSD
jgi:two-component system, NarL family, nitrate/nitrite response regulator NarL